MAEIFKILVTVPELPERAWELLNKTHEVIKCEAQPLKRSELLSKVKGVHGIIWATHDRLDAEILNAAGKQLKAISTMSAEFKHIDVNELQKRHILLGNTPDVMYNAVADLAIGLMIAAARRFHETRAEMANSIFSQSERISMLGQDIHDAIVGFYGFGTVGQKIAQRLKGFEVDHIIYHTRRRVTVAIEHKYLAVYVPFEDLLERSDFLFIAASLNADSLNAFAANAFVAMKENAVLINVADSKIVSEEDLVMALKQDAIFAAALDISAPESLTTKSALLSLPNCFVMPHMGSATVRSRTEMALIAAQNIVFALDGNPMSAPVEINT